MPPTPIIPTLDQLPAHASVRTRILTAAVELLHSVGFSALTQHAVADRAGVRQSHVTYYFPTRTSLLRSVAQFGCAQMIEPFVKQSARGQMTLGEFREFLLPTESDRGWIRLMTSLLSASEEDPSIKAWLLEFDHTLLAQLHAAFCNLVGPTPLLYMEYLHAVFVGSMQLELQRQTEHSLQTARQTVALAFDLLVAATLASTKNTETKT